MKVEFTARATRDYNDLPQAIKKAVDKQLDLLCERLENLLHPSIRAKKYVVADALIYGKGRVNRAYRFYFEIIGDVYRIVRIVPHPK
jgi:mRNA-degrading endonuclease RelE of RelBE toxin-antitoxin system